ncbi:MAG TPA: DUF975 family protein [Anaerovoracaceae bacterium]|nr:DUF975 family protein [Anaerovoracaceae bacterium]
MDQNIIVIESSRNLRALGRNALTGKWGLGVLGTVLYAVLTTVPVIILNAIFGDGDASPAAISNIYSLLITGPMTLGYAMFAISIFRKRETSPAEVFYGFERFGKAFGLYIVMIIFVLLWSLLLIVPGIIAAFRYSMCFYILADNPNIGIMEALNESKKMMRGNKWKFFCLNISFIGWGILCLLTLGIGFLWLGPYMEVSIIAFYDIANGSLRSVRNIEGANGVNSDGVRTEVDPITVYKEPEINEVETIESEAKELETIESEAKESSEIVEETKNEE